MVKFFVLPRSCLFQLWFVVGLFCLGLTRSFAHNRPSDAEIQPHLDALSPYKSQIINKLNNLSSLVDTIFVELSKQELPESFVLIPMLESSYNSNAISPANAAGLWQLMPATAKRFGLQVSDTRDERFDIKISTQAAIAYLTFLYKKFNQDITLTLAAYNAGEGRVARAIKGAGSREFKHLTLPKETQHYVKRFYALQQLVNVQQLVNTQQDLAKPPASLLLFSSQPKFSHQPIINFRRLPSLIKLGLVK